MFVLLRVGPNLAQNVHSQKSIFYFLQALIGAAPLSVVGVSHG
jgi:hypothetical protein